MVPTIKNIAIQGGGIKAVAYIRALVAVGYKIRQRMTLMSGTDIGKFKIGYIPFRIFTMYGIHIGNYILSFARDAIITKTNEEALNTSGKLAAKNYLLTRATRFNSTKSLLSQPA